MVSNLLPNLKKCMQLRAIYSHSEGSESMEYNLRRFFSLKPLIIVISIIICLLNNIRIYYRL